MSEYSSRGLASEDKQQVLQFELAHKDFFEQKIEARPAGFYQPDAVSQHIDDFLTLKQRGLAWPTLIFTAAGELIGRATIKDINPLNKTAYVGYRIAEHWSGKGVASFALTQLIQQAKQMGLKTLFACVSAQNPASERVLFKAGFERADVISQLAIVQGHVVAGYLLQRQL